MNSKIRKQPGHVCNSWCKFGAVGARCCCSSVVQQDKKKKKPIGILSLSLLIFFTVSGGLLGSEELISARGPLAGLVTCIVFPWIYSLPVALMAAELSAAFPEDGGYTLWVSEAFGPFWAFQEGYWSWVSGVLDNAMYPVVVADVVVTHVHVYLGEPSSNGDIHRTGAAILFALFMSIPNFFGVKLVGRALMVLALVVMLPFLLFVLLGVSAVDPAQWFVWPGTKEAGSEAAQWMHLLNVAFWSFSGWDSASTFAGEVEDPERSYPIALTASVGLVTLSYLVPLLVAVGNERLLSEHGQSSALWEDGSFVAIGGVVGGKLVQGAFFVSSLAGFTAMHVTEMCVDSYLLMGMADHGLAPSVFGKRLTCCGATGSPVNALLASLVVIVIASALLRFDALLWVNNCLSGLSVGLEIVAAIHLKYKSPPQSHKPYNLNVKPATFVLMLLPAMVILGIVVISSFVVDSKVLPISSSLIVFGIILYFVQGRFAKQALRKAPKSS